MQNTNRRQRRYNRPKPRNVKETKKDQLQDREIRKLKKLVGRPEIKYTDITDVNGDVSTDVQLIPLSGYISQGDTERQRIGMKLRNVFVRIKGYFVMYTTEDQDIIVRMQLFWDANPPQGTGLPTVYGNTSDGIAAVNDNTNTDAIPDIFAPHSLQYNKRFKVIKEKYITLKWEADTKVVKHKFDFSKKLGRYTTYDNTGPAAESVATNGLFLAYSIDNVTTADAVQCGLTARMYFTDD